MEAVKTAISVIGAGASGLFAAERLVRAGYRAVIYDHKPAAALKLRLAGSSGLNLTNTLPLAEFANRYGPESGRFQNLLSDFPNASMIAWARNLGVGAFEGSGGKILTADGDGSALIDSLLRFLRDSGRAEFRFGYRFSGFTAAGITLVESASGALIEASKPAIFALGGASWPRTGSDGTWVKPFTDAGIRVTPFRSANCGFDTPVSEGETGERLPLKNIAVTYGGRMARGDAMLTETGIEGGPVYFHASSLVHAMETGAEAVPLFDLYPDLAEEEILKRLSKPRGKASGSTFAKKALNLSPARVTLLRRALGRDAFARILADPPLVKRLPLPVLAARPLEEAISVSGGVAFAELDDDLMLRSFPGVYCVGEMLDWDAPTGGFLLTGCFATAWRAVSAIKGAR